MPLFPGGWGADMMAGVRAATLDQKLPERVAEQQDRRSLGPLETEKLSHQLLRASVGVGFLPLAADPT